MDEDLVNEIIWVMKHFGSDAGERAEPGSKLKAQAQRIAEFVSQRAQAEGLLADAGLGLVKITRWPHG